MVKCAHPPCPDDAMAKSKYGMCARHRERVRKGQVLSKFCKHCGDYFEHRNTSGKRLYCHECSPPNDRRAIFLLNRYGITKDEFDAMYFEQEGQCALAHCEKEAIAVDHWHGCQEEHGNAVACLRCVRGLLCRGCNAWLAPIEDPMFIGSAMEYLAEYKG